jgi:mono/diheme cytochrome c family protein
MMSRTSVGSARFRLINIGLVGFAVMLIADVEGVAKQEPAKAPMEFQQGEAKFNANCAGCHGQQATGTAQGPPLVHKIYEPNHHGDFAFQRAAANGVRAHHWQFGDMPKIEGVTPADVEQIIQYVRWLQRQAGIM